MSELVRAHERLDDLARDNLKIIQNPGSFCFSMDAVLLSSFVTVKRGDRVLDLGTGTGVIPLLLSSKTQALELCGLEIQADMADMASRSVRYNGLEGKIRVVQGDLREARALLGRDRFDVVVSNPPFTSVGRGLVPPTDGMAIARHEIMCTLEDVVDSCSRMVTPGGRVALVHRPSRLVDILWAMRERNLEPKRLRFVYPSMDAKPTMVMVEALKGGGKELEVMKPLYIYDDSGAYTQEVRDIYFGQEGEG